MLRALTILTLLAGFGWSAYWFAGRTALTRGVAAAAEAARREGWAVDWRALSVAGFPNRFDTEIRGLGVRSADGAWGLDAPGLEVMALSYRPNEVIAVAVPPLTLATPAGPFDLGADDLRASAAFTVGTPPEPVRATVVAEALTVQGADLVATVAAGLAAMREAAGDRAYDVALTLSDVALRQAAPWLPETLDAVALDATAVLDAPLSEGPVLAQLTLRRAEVVWDDAALQLSGDLVVGPGGTPEGTLRVSARNWEALLPLLSRAGMPEAQVALLAAGLAEVASEGSAEVPLTLSGGALRFGAIPIAPLPVLPVPYSP